MRITKNKMNKEFLKMIIRVLEEYKANAEKEGYIPTIETLIEGLKEGIE